MLLGGFNGYRWFLVVLAGYSWFLVVLLGCSWLLVVIGGLAGYRCCLVV